MNTRLSQFLAAENITQSQLADSLGVARAGISHIISGRNKPGYEFIAGIMRKYPDLNPDWLILGTGRMYRDSGRDKNGGNSQSSEFSYDGLLFPADSPADSGASEPADEICGRAGTEGTAAWPEGTDFVSDEPVAGTERQTAEAERPVAGTERQTAEAERPVAGTIGSEVLSGKFRGRTVSKVIVLFDDGTFQEMRG